MVKYCAFLLLLLGLTACGSSETESSEETLENNFHLEGTITGASLQKVKIEASSPNGTIAVAETMTNSDGKYVLDGNIPGLGVYSMTIGNDPANAIVLPLDINDRAVISGSLKDFAVSPKMSGAKWAKPLMKYMKLFKEFSEAQMEQLPKIEDDEERIAKYLELRKPLDAFLKKQVTADPGNSVNLILASLLVPTQELGIQHWDPENLDVLKKMESAYLKEHSDSPFTATLTQQLAQIEAQYNNYEQFNSGTLAAPEIAMKNPKGTELRLSSLKGKVVLIDFWASWCGPCRKENPNVVKLYKKYKSKGFEVFSVSLDQDANAWNKAITQDGLIWPNHVSDLLGWQTPMTQLYGFNAIPYTVLVNEEGNIVGVNLRGEELEQKLKEVLN
ncbi:MAG TPA: redoxin family protein [Fluviicola sp.]|nr:redoxin family protein [Fluviicola sp.]